MGQAFYFECGSTFHVCVFVSGASPVDEMDDEAPDHVGPRLLERTC